MKLLIKYSELLHKILFLMDTYSYISLNKNVSFFPAPVKVEGATTMTDVLTESGQISSTITQYLKDRQTYTDGIYNKDIVDRDGNILPTNDLKDALKKDLQTIIIQENTLFMVGVITTATLIIAAIFISK